VYYLKAALRLIRRAVVAMLISGSLLIGPRQVIPAYAANYTAATFAELVTAIDTANSIAGADTISLTADITLTGNLPLIKSDITFEGNSHSVNGNNTYRVFFVGGGVTLTAPTVTFRNMTIQNGRAQGGSGSGGGAGLGGGMFVYDGNVTVENVTFANNTATGGSGAWVSGGGGMGGNGGSNYGGGGGLWAGANGSSFTGSGGSAGNYGGGGSSRAQPGAFGGSGGGLNPGAGTYHAGGGGGVNGGNASPSHGGNGGWGGGGGGGAIGTGGVGGFGGGGGYGNGGNGGFGGGGGASGNGGFGGGTYGSRSPGYGGGSGHGGFGGGAGFGGGLFARDGLITLTNVAFNNNSANHGSSLYSASGTMGKGGGLFICKAGSGTGEIGHATAAECGAALSPYSCAVTFSGNTAQDDTAVATDNDNVFGNLGYAASACAPNVVLDKTVAPSTNVANHGTVTYQIVLSNQGTRDDSSVSFSDTLPSGVTFTSWVANPGATYSAGTINYSGAMTVLQNLTFTFTANHTGTYEDVINNTASYNATGKSGSDSAAFTVVPNYAPVLGAIGDKTVNELALLSFTATATDGNVNDGLTYSLDAGAPTGAAIDATTGAFTWTPSEAQGPGVYPITVRVTDSGGVSDYETINVTVSEVNSAPVLAAIGNKTVNELSALSFTATATDSDLPANTLTYSLDAGAPTGATINATTGAFTWTPTEAQGPGVYPITVRVTDNGSPVLNDYETINVTVSEVNSAPVLAAIGNKTVNELSALSFTATAPDSDLPANTLTYSLDAGAPTGAAINATTGAFTWTPTEVQGPGLYTITVRVGDGGTPVLEDQETIQITVNDVNVAPMASGNTYTTTEDTAFSVGVPGLLDNDSDADIPIQALSAVLDIPPVEGILTFALDGSFTYTPTLNFNGTITFTYHANDSLVDSNIAVVSIIVTETNDPPVANDQAITTDEDIPYSGLLAAADVDGDQLAFALETAPVHGLVSIALDSSFTYTPTLDYNGTDVFTFTVTDGEYSDLGRVEITINAVNDLPVVDAGADQTSSEGQLTQFNGTYFDVGLSSIQAMPIAWDFGDGATITGTLTPIHTYADDGVYTVTLMVDDGEGGVGLDTLLITVNNAPPILPELQDSTIQSGQSITLTVVFIDPGVLDTHTVTITWEPGVTDTLHLAAGVMSFTTIHQFAQAGSYAVDVMVTDKDGGLDAGSFTATVLAPPRYMMYLPIIHR
jgi:uncharacterized repeat protein (TIGR01451 family)